MPEKFEASSRYQNGAGADSPKSALETEDHVPRAEHIDPIKVVPHQGRSTYRVHHHSKGHLLTPSFEGNPTYKSRASPLVAYQEGA